MAPMDPIDCPRCGAAGVVTPACPRCGVIVAKALATPARPPRVPAPVSTDEPAERGSDGSGRIWALVAVIFLGIGFGAWQRSQRRKEPPPDVIAQAAPVTSRAEAFPPPPRNEIAIPLPDASTLRSDVKGMAAADREQSEALIRHLARGGAMTAADVSGAEQLHAAHPEDAGLRNLLEAVLLSAAEADRKRRDFAGAVARLRRAAAVNPASANPHVALFGVFNDAQDWAGAESAARAALAIDRTNVAAWQSLGHALWRLDRSREAVEALREALSVRESSQTRDLLERVEKGLSDEHGMKERQLAHFNVRYDGDEHEAVGREILRALERHYMTLVSAMDHQPAGTIPVVLFTRQGYYDASGAPAWAGGSFDLLDGRIRIPIGGLTASLTPDMDGTLIHELTHAFIFDRSRGVAPREVHEGLAQYMEGKRSLSDASPQYLSALADGRVGGVGAFYLAALSYVEHLIALRGMGGMNDLLKAMGETGDRDEAFQRVHGQTYDESRRAWAQHLRKQYGS